MSIYDDIGLSSVNNSKATADAAKKSNSYLGQEEFLSLLTTELSYQDPTSPVDNSQMVSQMAQLSMVSSLAEIDTSVSGLSSSLTSSQAYMASSFVGTEVRLGTNSGYFNGTDSSQFAVIAGEGASNMTLTITDQNGAVVNTVALGDGSGDINLYWDGTNSEGKIVGAATKDCGVQVNSIIKEAASVLGGGGGGRPNLAQGAGPNADKMAEALDLAVELLNKN
jgi:flagellar basal-body rod modification protein FlgD